MTHPKPRRLFQLTALTGLLLLSACSQTPAPQVEAAPDQPVADQRASQPLQAQFLGINNCNFEDLLSREALGDCELLGGAYNSGRYPVPFKDWNNKLSDAEIKAKLDAAWAHYFSGTDDSKRVYFPAGNNANGPKAYILDIADNDVRTEGLSYGMMIAVQMNRKTEFDALWNWAYTNMLQADGPYRGYFAWHATPGGAKLDQNPAPDGEEYFATALFFASGRWGDGKGIYNYQGQANNILNFMLHKKDIDPASPATNMFGPENQVVFVPDAQGSTFTDPSYHLPAFYELWARWATSYTPQTKLADRLRWLKIAQTSRKVLWPRSTHPVTGLNPSYSNFDGTPHRAYTDDDTRYAYDAWRVGMNWGVDSAWFGRNHSERVWADQLQSFMIKQGVDTLHNVYTLDGVAQDTYHDQGHVSMLATAGLATRNPQRLKFVEALWKSDFATGKYRYYSGMLQFLALLNNAGQYRIYAPTQLPTPAPLPEPPVVTPPALPQTLTFSSFATAPDNASVQGGAYTNYTYSEKPGDAAAQPVVKNGAAGTITTAYTISKDGGSSYAGVTTILDGKPDDDGNTGTPSPSTDLSSYTGLTIKLSATGATQLQVKVAGNDASVLNSGCYPVHVIDVTSTQTIYTVPLNEATFAPRSYCGTGGRSLADTLGSVTRVEVEDNIGPATGTKAASMTIGTVEFTK